MTTERALAIAGKVEDFVREVVFPYEQDPRRDHHGAPTDELVFEMRDKARAAGVLSPHILPDGEHLTQRETATILIRSGLSPLGPLACNTNAPDEGNMYLLGKVGSPAIKERFLEPLVAGRARSAFLMTEPADWQGAGSDPSMMKTTCRQDGNHWVIDGRKTFITGFLGAKVGIVMARAEEGACMFLVDLPDPAISIEHIPNTIDSSMPGGHATLTVDGLRVPADQMLGQAGEGFQYAQVRLSPARLSHCMRWLGACLRAQEIATDYACRRQAFGKLLIGIYLAHSAFTSTYGAAGSLIVVLVWIYYSTQIFFLGAEFTQVYSRYMGAQIILKKGRRKAPAHTVATDNAHAADNAEVVNIAKAEPQQAKPEL